MSIYFLMLLFFFLLFLFFSLSFLLVGRNRHHYRYKRGCAALLAVLFGRAHGCRGRGRVRGRGHDQVVAVAMLILPDSQVLFSSGLINGGNTKINRGDRG